MALGSHASESFLAYQFLLYSRCLDGKEDLDLESGNLNLMTFGFQGRLKKELLKQTIDGQQAAAYVDGRRHHSKPPLSLPGKFFILNISGRNLCFFSKIFCS